MTERLETLIGCPSTKTVKAEVAAVVALRFSLKVKTNEVPFVPRETGVI
jgi:hypothetical protein